MTDAAERGGPNGTADESGRTGEPPSPTDVSLRRRIVEQFSGAGERATVWRGFEWFLPTTEYLNIGYSPWYLPTLVGDSQARLATRLADGLTGRLHDTAGVPLLDVGCGRGGPARQFAARGFAVTGVDLVPHNVALARTNARDDADAVGCDRPRFVVGDATHLPFADDAFAACVAVDSPVYLPDEGAAFADVRRVLSDGGWLATSTLLAADDDAVAGDGAAGVTESPDDADDALDAFADAWDLAPIPTTAEYFGRLRAAGFAVETVDDVTANSVARFGKWSGLFLAVADGPTAGALRALLRRLGVAPDVAVPQVRAAHRALPHLQHVIVYARATTPRERPHG